MRVEYHQMTAHISEILVFAGFGASLGQFSYDNRSPPFGAECARCGLEKIRTADPVVRL
ncbi:hypothetical protein GGE12_001364 [Rhizobium mongolense]|uniref:Uncharacterized protein n=1 Tax=Rhizobium mongolense TaxID=57676 RepID=A0A7W6RJG2_9HYPH|nr:hypothetical protein [Rhizobium mongolense]